MSTSFYSIVDRDALPAEAEALERTIVDWLVGTNIVERELSPCVHSPKDLGHRPGREFMLAAGEPERPGVANMDYKVFVGDRVNGLEVIRGRHITISPEGEMRCAVCNACGAEHPIDEEWNRAASEWLDQNAPGELVCGACKHTESVAEWEHKDPIGFGALTFVFWNWPPPPGDAFVQEFSRRLGHRVSVIVASI